MGIQEQSAALSAQVSSLRDASKEIGLSGITEESTIQEVADALSAIYNSGSTSVSKVNGIEVITIDDISRSYGITSVPRNEGALILGDECVYYITSNGVFSKLTVPSAVSSFLNATMLSFKTGLVYFGAAYSYSASNSSLVKMTSSNVFSKVYSGEYAPDNRVRLGETFIAGNTSKVFMEGNGDRTIITSAGVATFKSGVQIKKRGSTSASTGKISRGTAVYKSKDFDDGDRTAVAFYGNGVNYGKVNMTSYVIEDCIVQEYNSTVGDTGNIYYFDCATDNDSKVIFSAHDCGAAVFDVNTGESAAYEANYNKADFVMAVYPYSIACYNSQLITAIVDGVSLIGKRVNMGSTPPMSLDPSYERLAVPIHFGNGDNGYFVVDEGSIGHFYKIFIDIDLTFSIESSKEL